MSFTIKCNTCKREVILEDGKFLFKDDSTIKISGNGGYDGHFSTFIECECKNNIADSTEED